ncbi:MAG: TIGR03943 family protein [Actinomycetota bacterium]
MTRAGRGMMLLAIALAVGRMTWNGTFGNFVQQHMRWPLAIAAVCVFVLGVVDIVGWARTEADDDPSVAPSVGILMVLPIAVLIAVAPAALGSAALDRVDPFEPTEPDDDAWVLPDDDLLDMRVIDFVNQALYDDEQHLEGRSVVLEGLAVNDDEFPDGFLLVRFLVSCCAADGIPVIVALRDAPQQLEDDTWVRATVTWIPPDIPYFDPDGPLYIEAEIESLEVIPDPPLSPYESPF